MILVFFDVCSQNSHLVKEILTQKRLFDFKVYSALVNKRRQFRIIFIYSRPV